MKTKWTCILAALILLALPVMGQTDVNALETAIHGKPFGLRGYPADAVATYTWFDGKLVPDTVILHGLGAFIPDTVRQKGSKILIEGQFETLVRAQGKIAPMGKLPMRLEVDLQKASPATVFPQLQSLLFFPSLGDALKSLPEYVADMLPYPIDTKLQPPCNCFHVLQDGKWIQVDNSNTNLVPPAFTKMVPNPALDQMAIDAKIYGTITLIYLVSDVGRVDELWLARPLGANLDESAAKTSREDMFKPATLDGKPVGTILVRTIPVNYSTAPAVEGSH
ncbi:MAG: energy transducer TonB [Acidobacteriaceae bacterium]